MFYSLIQWMSYELAFRIIAINGVDAKKPDQQLLFLMYASYPEIKTDREFRQIHILFRFAIINYYVDLLFYN